MAEYVFEKPEWEAYIDTLRYGSTVAASNLLALLAKENDDTVEEAFEYLARKRISVNVFDLPVNTSNSTFRARLELERSFVSSGANVTCLETKDPLRIYLSEIVSSSIEQEATMAESYLVNPNLAEQVFISGMRRAAEIAFDYAGLGILLMDLIQEANLALWECISGYHEGDYRKLSEEQIRRALEKAVFTQAKNEGVGLKIAEYLQSYKNTSSILRKKLGRDASQEEYAVEMSITPELVANIQKMLKDAEVLQETLRLLDAKDADAHDAEDELAVEDTAYYKIRERVSELLSNVDELDARILILRYGLESAAPLSVDETSLKLNLSAEEVTKREAAALCKLRSTDISQ